VAQNTVVNNEWFVVNVSLIFFELTTFCHCVRLQTKIRAMKVHAFTSFLANARDMRAERFLKSRILKRWAKLTVIHVHLRRLSRQLIDITRNMLKRRVLYRLRAYVKGVKVGPHCNCEIHSLCMHSYNVDWAIVNTVEIFCH
jgi:hypothetical protein